MLFYESQDKNSVPPKIDFKRKNDLQHRSVYNQYTTYQSGRLISGQGDRGIWILDQGRVQYVCLRTGDLGGGRVMDVSYWGPNYE